MMRNGFVTRGFQLFDGIVEEKVDENGVDIFRIGMITDDLSPKLFNAPYAAASQFNLPSTSIIKGLLFADMCLQWWTIHKRVQRMKHLRNAVI